jgi:hypothetical protein
VKKRWRLTVSMAPGKFFFFLNWCL